MDKDKNKNTIRIAGVIGDSIVDGPGLRLTIFVQGCPHNCEGCHNPETHDFDGGTEYELESFTHNIIDELDCNPILSGVTFSGGEPMCQPSALLYIAKKVVEKGKNIVIFSGYTFEELMNMSKSNCSIKELLELSILLVDGKFELKNRNLAIKFRGSTNQRLIDPKASIKEGKIIEWKSKFDI